MKYFKHAFLVSLFLSTSLFAAQAPLNLRHSIDLENFKGHTYLEMMMSPDGVKAHFDEDYVDTYEFASWEQVKFALGHLDTKIVRNVMRPMM